MIPRQRGHPLNSQLIGRESDRRGKDVRTFVLILNVFMNAFTISQVYAASPSGQFENRLTQLQRRGDCGELPRFGVSTHQGRNPDDINVTLATDIGAQIVRIDITWADVEKGGSFDFKKFDHLIRELRQKNKSIILILDYGHPDHTDEGLAAGFPFVPRTLEQQDAYFRYARAVVERFRGPDITYEVWNEPNLKYFWPLTATAYGALLKGAAASIRKIDPKATVLAAGIANMENRDHFVRELIAATSLDQVNALAFHPYRQDGPENSLLDIAEFENAAAAGGQQRAVWLTEWGYSESWLARKYPSDDVRERQAIMTARLMLTAAIAKTKAAILYDLIDDGPDSTDPEFTFGMYDYKFRAKKAALAFRTLANLMSNCETYNFEFDPVRKVITAAFTDKLQISHVFWTYDNSYDQEICFESSSSKAAHLFDIYGKQLPTELCHGSSGIKLKVLENRGPLILTTDR